MPRRSKLTLEAMRTVGNEDCPHCNAILSPSEYLRVDSERLRCGKCGKDFIPKAKNGPTMRTS
jgi:ribosomal protein S27AE